VVVTDEDDAPIVPNNAPGFVSLSGAQGTGRLTKTINENITGSVGTLTAEDIDAPGGANGQHDFEITFDPLNLFRIDNGQLRLRASIDYEHVGPSYVVLVRAIDRSGDPLTNMGPQTEITFTINDLADTTPTTPDPTPPTTPDPVPPTPDPDPVPPTPDPVPPTDPTPPVIVINGSNGSNNLRGSGASEEINAGAGNDLVKAGAGDDDIRGGTGRDTLYGGKGADKFIFDTKLSKGNVDKIMDFEPGDTIGLDKSIFKELSGQKLKPSQFVVGDAAEDPQDRIIYNSKTGDLMYDSDGSGGKKAIVFAEIGKNEKLDAGDFFLI
jgi:Ca2+-binding RTX toxin-like protein